MIVPLPHRLYSAKMGMTRTWDIINGRLPAMMVAEIAFLVSLTSADSRVSTMAARGLREIAMAEASQDELGLIDEPEEAAKRYPVYEQLGDPSVVTLGELPNTKSLQSQPC